jgi:hypothetical protein
MKFQLKNIAIAMVAAFTITSCSKDDDNGMNGNGNLNVSFENGFDGDQGITLGSTFKTTTNNQVYNYTTLKYIVSNVVLIKADGTEVKFNYNNPDKGAFIIDQADGLTEHPVALTDIPAGDYTKIRFGLGISSDAYTLGQSGQATFWTKAASAGMTWNWAAGYRFIRLEGVYGATQATATETYMHHFGNSGNPTVNGTPNIYKEITLDLPTSAKVRTNITPLIHIGADFTQHLDGTTKIILDSTNDNAMSSSMQCVQDMVNNLSAMFTVEHVHND